MGYLRDKRIARKLSQSQVADACQMARSTYSRLERGLTTGTTAQAAALNRLLGVAVLTGNHLLSERDRRELAEHPLYDLPMVNAEPWRITEQTYGAQEGVSGEVWQWLQTFVHADSSLECRALSQFVQAGFEPKADSPLLWGFEQHTLLDSKGSLLGARYLPCLLYRKAKLRLCLWPQVTLRVEQNAFRVDALVFYRSEKASGWLVLEIDGGGHRAAGDLYRSSLLRLSEFRLSDSDVRARRCAQKLLGYVTA